MSEGISEIDLHAYVDGQLDMARRIEVEAWLQDHPEAASRMMQDLRFRNEIRLFLAEEHEPPVPATLGLIRDLGRRLKRSALNPRLQRGVAATILLLAGWIGHAAVTASRDSSPDDVPLFVDEAVEAHAATKKETDITGSKHFPIAMRNSGGALQIPDLSDLLTRLGAHVVPWDGGVAIETVYRSAEGAQITFFAAEVEQPVENDPQATVIDGVKVLYWQSGHVVYALSGDALITEIDEIAKQAARRSK